jgi:hypothetical protein
MSKEMKMKESTPSLALTLFFLIWECEISVWMNMYLI